jgi:predicted component of viral defense system (DUF524 family)
LNHDHGYRDAVEVRSDIVIREGESRRKKHRGRGKVQGEEEDNREQTSNERGEIQTCKVARGFASKEQRTNLVQLKAGMA